MKVENVFDSANLRWFRRYEEVRESGKFNMITDCIKAAKEAGLSMYQYKFVINNYEDLKEQYEQE